MAEHHTHGTSLKKSVYAKSACMFQEIGEINLLLHFPDLSKIFRQALLDESKHILSIDRLHINLLEPAVIRSIPSLSDLITISLVPFCTASRSSSSKISTGMSWYLTEF
jgi:hypothetical protein